MKRTGTKRVCIVGGGISRRGAANRFSQGRGNTYYCGAHTAINSHEHGLISGLAVARQLGADYPFDDAAARERFNVWDRSIFGGCFRKA